MAEDPSVPEVIVGERSGSPAKIASSSVDTCNAIPCRFSGTTGEVVYDLLDPNARTFLLTKDEMMQYRLPDVETAYLAQMVGPHRLTLSFFCLIIVCIYAVYGSIETLSRWNSQMRIISFSWGGMLAVAGITNAVVYFKATENISVSVHEKLTLFVCGSAALLATQTNTWARSCTDLATEQGKTLIQSLSCRRALIPMAFQIQVLPVIVRQSRPVLGMPLPFLTPVAMAFGYFLDSEDAETDVFIFTLIVLLFTGCIYAHILWEEAKSMRGEFEAWVILQRNTKKVKRERAEVDTLTQALLPARMWHRLRQAEASFEVSSEQLVAVYQLCDFSTWAVHFLAPEAVKVLSDLFGMFDKNIRAIGRGVLNITDGESRSVGSVIFEKCKAVGEMYIVTAGFLGEQLTSRPRADRLPLLNELVKFCRLQLRLTNRLHALMGTPECRLTGNLQCPPLQACCGVHVGSCGIGIVGTGSLWLEVVGEALRGALQMAREAEPGTIATTDAVQRILENDDASSPGSNDVQGRQNSVVDNEDGDVTVSPESFLNLRTFSLSADSSHDGSTSPAGRSISSFSIENERAPLHQSHHGLSITAPALFSPSLSVISARSSLVNANPLRAAERFAVLRDRIRLHQEDQRQQGREEGIDVPDNLKLLLMGSSDSDVNEFESREFAQPIHHRVQECRKNLRWYRWSFGDSALDEAFADFIRKRSIHAGWSLRFRIAGLLLVLLFVASIEPQPITAAAAVLFPLSILVVLLTVALPHRVVRRFSPWLLTPLYALPFICVAVLNPDSVLSGRVEYLTAVVSIFHFYYIDSAWKGVLIEVLIIISTFCVEYFRRRPESEVISTIYLNLFVVLVLALFLFSRHERRSRLEFLQGVLSSLYWYDAAAEFEINSGLLNMLVPKALVPSLQAGAGNDQTHISWAIVAIIRLQNFSAQFSDYACSPEDALAYVEARYGAIERALRLGDGIIERVHTCGDDVVVGGPLLRAKDRVLRDGGKTAAFSKYEKTTPKEDALQSAAVAMMEMLTELFRSPDIGAVSCAVHTDTALGWLCGRDRPTFLLIGPVMRVLGAMIDAVPTTIPTTKPCFESSGDEHVLFSTSAFRRVFENVSDTFEESTRGVTFGPEAVWSLRACGRVAVSHVGLILRENCPTERIE